MQHFILFLIMFFSIGMLAMANDAAHCFYIKRKFVFWRTFYHSVTWPWSLFWVIYSAHKLTQNYEDK